MTFIVIEMLNHNKLMVVLTFPKSKRGAKAYNLESYKCSCPRKLRQIVLLTSHYRHYNDYLAQQHYPVHGSILPEFSVPSNLLFFLQDYSIMNDCRLQHNCSILFQELSIPLDCSILQDCSNLKNLYILHNCYLQQSPTIYEHFSSV